MNGYGVKKNSLESEIWKMYNDFSFFIHLVYLSIYLFRLFEVVEDVVTALPLVSPPSAKYSRTSR